MERDGLFVQVGWKWYGYDVSLLLNDRLHGFLLRESYLLVDKKVQQLSAWISPTKMTFLAHWYICQLVRRYTLNLISESGIHVIVSLKKRWSENTLYLV